MGRSRSRSLDRYRAVEPDRNRGRSSSRDRHASSSSRHKSRTRDRSRSHGRSESRLKERSRSRGAARQGDRKKDGDRRKDRRDDKKEERRQDRRDEKEEDGRVKKSEERNGERSRHDSRSRHHEPREKGREREHRNGGERGAGREREKENRKEEGERADRQGAARAVWESEGEKKRSAPKGDDEEDMDEASLLGGLTEEDEERLIEERKRKRQQILEEHRKKEMELKGALEGKSTAELEEEEAEERRKRRKEGTQKKEVEQKAKEAASDSDEEDEEEGNVVVTTQRKVMSDDEDEELDKSGDVNGVKEEVEERELGTGAEEGASVQPSLDMFCFSPSKDGHLMIKPGKGLMLESAAIREATGHDTDHLEDNWDDPEGYYKTMVSEVLADRYVVLGSIGRGVFSTVLKCQDRKATGTDGKPVTVAIKMVRSNDVMRKAAMKELDLLREISAADPDNKKHCVRLLGTFEHRNHVALVFESLQMNMRETLRKFGKHVGINIGAVRTYAKQLLVALKHIGQLGVVHADIKPDNILVNDGFSQLKLCDFGSAFKEEASDNDPTPYLVSRFYRAPEIILGFEYNRAVDLWSIGCCLYELFTGRVTFPGVNNNEMLRLMMEMKGPLPAKSIRKHRQAYEKLQLEPMFEDDGKFRQQELDPVTKKPQMRVVHVTKATRDLTNILLKAKTASDDRNMVLHLANLLDKIFTLDPVKRITVKEALHHPFVSSGSQARKNG